MSEATNGGQVQATGNPVGQGGGQPSGQSGYAPPSGYRLVPETDWSAAQRWREQASGSQAEIEKYKKEIESFKSWEPLIAPLKQGGVDPSRLLQQEQKGAEVSGLRPEQVEELFSKRFGEFESKLKKSSAMESHTAGWAATQKALDKLVEQTVGKDASDDDKAMVRAAARGLMYEYASAYPEGHPLHGEAVSPLDEGGVSKIQQQVENFYKGRKGAALSEIAAAATRTASTVPAGKSPNAGGASVAPTGRQSKTELIREKIAQSAQAYRAKRGITT